MTAETPVQAAIIDRLDKALGALETRGLVPRAIYLAPDDYEEFAACETACWRSATGSTALVRPLAYGDVLLITEKLIEQVEIPVRQFCGPSNRGSAVYASTGQCVMLDLAREL